MIPRSIRLSFVLLLLTVWVGWSSAGGAKNVILMVGDGMGPNHVNIYHNYAERVLSKTSAISQLMDAGEVGLVLHYPAKGLVTDSAAGATAFACGVKTLNQRIAVDPEGNALPTFLEIAKRNGKRTAVVTNIPPFDATEAAFLAHTPDRGNFHAITSAAFYDAKPDMLLGTGFKGKVDTEDGDPITQEEVTEKALKNGYEVVSTPGDLAKLDIHKLTYGIFDVKTPYQDLPAPAQRSYVTLSELTRAALQALKQSEDGFFVMIEGAKIDKVSHPNDAAAMLREMEEFDKSIAAAFDFAKQNPDTLLLVTADHETGGLNILGGDTEDLAKLGLQKEPLSAVKDRLGDKPQVEDIRKAFSEATGIEFKVEEAQRLLDNWKDPESTWGDILSKHTKVGFISTDHTATPVILAAYGPGSELCDGFRDNTETFSVMMEATGMTR